MADIRYLNQFGMPGGFNITSGEPIDSRAYVADIEHIYSADNWKTVKPYKGLIVSAPDGQVRICVDDKNYTSVDAWKEIGAGAGAIQVETYEEAIAAANSDKLGQIVYITTDGSFGEGESTIEYTAGAYIVTGDGALSKLGTTSVSGDIAGDVATLKTDVDALENVINGKDDEPGLISRVESLEGIDHTQYVVKDGDKVLSTNDFDNDAKAKLEGVAAGAQVNTIESIKVNGVEVPPVDKVVDITIDAPVYDETIGETPSNTTAPTTSAVKTYVDAVKSNIDDIVNSLEGKVNAIETWKLEIIPEADKDAIDNNFNLDVISHKTIYLVPVESTGDNNIYAEYVFIDTNDNKEDKIGQWEKLGEFKSDFDPTGLNTAIEGLGTRIGNIETKLANYDTLVSDVATLKSAVGDDASGLIKDVNYLKDTVDGIVSVGGEANLVNDVTVDGASIVADKIAVLNTAKSATEDEEATGGLMSKEDKVKLDSLNFEAISNDLIEQIVNGSANA